MEEPRFDAYLLLYVTKVDIQLLQQTRLALVPFGGKCSNPARLQPALLAHAPRDTNTRCRAKAKVCAATGRGAAVATVGGSLGRGGMARDIAWCAVGGLEELEVLGGLGRVGWVALWWSAVAVGLGHDGGLVVFLSGRLDMES